MSSTPLGKSTLHCLLWPFMSIKPVNSKNFTNAKKYITKEVFLNQGRVWYGTVY